MNLNLEQETNTEQVTLWYSWKRPQHRLQRSRQLLGTLARRLWIKSRPVAVGAKGRLGGSKLVGPVMSGRLSSDGGQLDAVEEAKKTSTNKGEGDPRKRTKS